MAQNFLTKKRRGQIYFLGILLLFICLSFFSLEKNEIRAANWSDNGIRATSFASGNGNSSNTAYEIKNAAQLGYFASVASGSASKGKYYKLSESINLKGNNWEPITDF